MSGFLLERIKMSKSRVFKDMSQKQVKGRKRERKGLGDHLKHGGNVWQMYKKMWSGEGITVMYGVRPEKMMSSDVSICMAKK